MSDTLNIEEQLEAIDLSNAEQQRYVDRAKAFEKLSETEEFKLVIEEGLLIDEMNRLNELLLTPNIKDMETTETIISKILTIRYYNEYFGSANYQGVIKTQAANAKQVIKANEEYREELLAEEMK